MFHVNPLPSRGSTWNIKSYFIRKKWKHIQDCRLLQSWLALWGLRWWSFDYTVVNTQSPLFGVWEPREQLFQEELNNLFLLTHDRQIWNDNSSLRPLVRLTFKEPGKIAADNTYLFYFYLSKKCLMFSREFTGNIKSYYFSLKNNKTNIQDCHLLQTWLATKALLSENLSGSLTEIFAETQGCFFFGYSVHRKPSLVLWTAKILIDFPHQLSDMMQNRFTFWKQYLTSSFYDLAFFDESKYKVVWSRMTGPLHKLVKLVWIFQFLWGTNY